MAIEAAVASTMDPILRAIVTISVLIFFAKIMASVFSNMKLPAVLGELIAGVVFGPYALGSGIIIFGEPLVVLNEYVDAFAEIGAIMILFSMGLEMGLTSLKENGAWAALIACLGDLTAFVITYEIYIRLGFSQSAALFIAAIMVATSLAISARVLEDLDMLKTEEGTLLVNAVAIDDILSVALLAVVTSIVFHGNVGVVEVAKTIIIFFIIWLTMVAVGAFVLPRMIERFMMLETEGAVEAASIASAFVLAALAGSIGLSPIVGSYAAGMAVAESKALPHIKDFIRHINTIFSPIFFTVVGAKMNIGLVSEQVIMGILLMTAIALSTKFVGCFTAALAKVRDIMGATRISVGMIPRGELSLIIASIALSKGVVAESVYVQTVSMVILTSIIAPTILSRLYRVSQKGGGEQVKELGAPPPPPKPGPESGVEVS
ncbi:MAG: hypothetical protein DRN65_02720 [Thaumarchaeota archaeon]|nr:MAG: hypothetical protein DRN65_02720 [Nitrososphaerota archaeon]